MNPEGNGAAKRFRISISQLVTKAIKKLKKRALNKGIGAEFDRAYGIIVERLRADPEGFGELTGEFQELDLLLHVGSVPPLRVEFAYHKSEPFVVIRKMASIGD